MEFPDEKTPLNTSIDRDDEELGRPSSSSIANDKVAEDETTENKSASSRGVLRLNTASVSKLTRRIRISMLKHSLAASYFENRQFYFFTIPQALLGLLASYFALATENSTIAGILSAVAVLLQTIDENCEYAQREVMHSTVSVELANLREELGYLKDKIDLKKDLGVKDNENPMHDDLELGTTKERKRRNEDFDSINRRITHLLDLCKSRVPMQIDDAFLAIESELSLSTSQALMKNEFMKSETNTDLSKNQVLLDNYVNQVQTKAFDLLNAKISNYFFFPLFLPNSLSTAEEVTEKLVDRCQGMERLTSVFHGNVGSSRGGDEAEESMRSYRNSSSSE
eukprot:CAMPEP_0116120328 /NCGR_PEP_ID=MMETSP0329-20121206/3117_1 /TAXON_ID=697910 /ORGANISM="Pseudo-nitzschia arenysensis, Strain B593" /LENGTH=338 /DNA_ID=CAMNT_0003614091 /DNA_START=203 /DNA_END=1219 /DNA_ORIENTATION=-